MSREFNDRKFNDRKFNDKVRRLYVDMITDLLDLVWVRTGMISLNLFESS